MNEVIPGAKPDFAGQIDAILADVRKILESGSLTQGKFLEEFEKITAESCGTKYAVGTNSGGTALELVLKAIDVRGKEVIVPTNTFVATANAVILAGGTPVFVDVRRDTLCADPQDVKNKISEKTAGVMFVQMFGLMTHDLAEISKICDEKSLFLVEDAAHAHGASLDGKAAGSWGDAGCFSYYATKIITTGEGGMITTSRKDIYEKTMSLRFHGKSLTEPVFVTPANNYRLAEIPSAIGLHQMKGLKNNNAKRERFARIYRAELKDAKGIELLPEIPGAVNGNWRFPLYVDAKIRNKLQTNMAKNHNVRIIWMYEPLCHLQPVFKDRFNCKKGDYPAAEKCMDELINLPLYSSLSEEDIHFVANSLKKELNSL
jgi:perosamine synthetase